MQLSGDNTYKGGTTVTAGTSPSPGSTPSAPVPWPSIPTAMQLQSSLGQSVVVPSVTFDGSPGSWTGTLDLTNNKLIVQATVTHAAAVVTLQTQSHSVLNSSTMPMAGIAVIDNGALATPFATFGNQPVDTNSILIAPELLGDSNADGHVDLTDLSAVLNNFLARIHRRLDLRKFRRRPNNRPHRFVRRPE